MNVVGFVWRIEWSNPYTQPPDGGLRVLAEVFIPNGVRNRCPPEIESQHVLGSGYAVCCRAVVKPIKRRTPEQLALTRQARLRNRMTKQWPLLAEVFIAEELAKRPDYYLEGKSSREDEREAVLAEQQKEYDRYMGGAANVCDSVVA